MSKAIPSTASRASPVPPLALLLGESENPELDWTLRLLVGGGGVKMPERTETASTTWGNGCAHEQNDGQAAEVRARSRDACT